MRDGTWFAGYYGPDSYASSYPDPPNLFVEACFDFDDSSAGQRQRLVRGGEAPLDAVVRPTQVTRL